MATDSRRSERPSGSGHPLPLFGRSGARWQQHIDRPLTHPDRLNDETKESAMTAAVSTVTKLEQPPDGRAQAPRPFGWRDKFGYLFGDCGNDFTFLLQCTFFLIFDTTVMGLTAAPVGPLLSAARILAPVTAAGAGRLRGALPLGRSGRFKPWLLRLLVPVAAAAVLMFSPFLQAGGYGARLAWMVVTYIL